MRTHARQGEGAAARADVDCFVYFILLYWLYLLFSFSLGAC